MLTCLEKQKLDAQRDFDWLKDALENYELPVIDRPKAVLELWELWEKLREAEKGEICPPTKQP